MHPFAQVLFLICFFFFDRELDGYMISFELGMSWYPQLWQLNAISKPGWHVGAHHPLCPAFYHISKDLQVVFCRDIQIVVGFSSNFGAFFTVYYAQNDCCRSS